MGRARSAAGELFKAWGETDVAEATRLVDICLEAGLTMFDSADIYSRRAWPRRSSGRRSRAGATRCSSPPRGPSASAPGPNDVGSSRYHLIHAVEASLRRLGTDYIDLYQLHGFDAMTPVEEALSTLDDLVRAGKIRYIGCSNFSGWHLMKSLAVSEKYGLARYVAHQAYYSLIGRDYEWELMPLALDQKVGAVVWSPLGWGRLTGKIRRGQPLPQTSRLHEQARPPTSGPPVADEYLYKVVDALDAVAARDRQDRAADRAQLAAPAADAWRPSIIGARNEEQLRQNLGAVGWNLTPAQIAQLDAASAVQLPGTRTGTSGASPSGIRRRYSRTCVMGPFLKCATTGAAGDACASL